MVFRYFLIISLFRRAVFRTQLCDWVDAPVGMSCDGPEELCAYKEYG